MLAYNLIFGVFLFDLLEEMFVFELFFWFVFFEGFVGKNKEKVRIAFLFDLPKFDVLEWIIFLGSEGAFGGWWHVHNVFGKLEGDVVSDDPGTVRLHWLNLLNSIEKY